MRVTATVVVFVLLVLLRGCSQPDRGIADEPPDPGALAPLPPPPATAPAIRGVVTAAEPGAIRVEADPAAESGPKAVVRIAPTTAVRYRAGGPLPPAELTVGHNVSVWFTGPVAESYPVRATAAFVVVEPVTVP